MSSTITNLDPLGSQTRWKSVRKHLNFYRIHIIVFTFTPLIFSAIFYASNGRHHISYIDALFNCVSAMTVCGLATVNLSSLTGWQQVILFIQMCLGSPVVVSWVMVYLRRYYFARKFEHIIEAATSRKVGGAVADAEKNSQPWPTRFVTFLRQGRGLSVVAEDSKEGSAESERKGGILRKLRPDMIRRMDDAPKLVNPSGWISEGKAMPARRSSMAQSRHESNRHPSSSPVFERHPLHTIHSGERPTIGKQPRRLSDPGIQSRPSSPVSGNLPRSETVADGNKLSPKHAGFPRTHTVEFAPSVTRRRGRTERRYFEHESVRPGPDAVQEDRRSTRRPSIVPPVSISTHMSGHTHRSLRSKDRGFGGFPMPHEILNSLVGRFFPKLRRKFTRTITIPVVRSLTSHRGDVSDGVKAVPYISFDAIVGRNSTFHLLTNEQIEELGGVEYRALNALLWIVAGYHIGVQALSFVVIAPYISAARWSENFIPPQEQKPLSPTWFSLFQVVSSYTNTGTSLVDQSMVPFQRAYPMVILMAFLILAGNTAFPIFLRFTIWILTKFVPERSRTNETLHFLLDHPRRCFIYLFPSHQTWFLLTVVLTLTLVDWFCFLVLDIGNPVIEAIPVGVRVLSGLLQAIAVRAAGFGIVALSALAPAVKVMYVVMMYISVYPIAMSVRSTNVYEEQSLGVFDDEDESDDEDDFEPTGPRMTVWSRYLAMHARRQLAFDMWWLALALVLVCILERGNITNEQNLSWFTIFNILFELVSAYGTVGLSLGIPTQNYSFSGAFRPLSKLIICLVMIRGRHRGLPVAIDRAVMLPSEFQKPRDEPLDDRSQYPGSVHIDHQDMADDVRLSTDQTVTDQYWRRAAKRRSIEEPTPESPKEASKEDDENSSHYH
ncbi:cation transport protein-domain-containing protein [Infundibulicybe gibba]|nr:cation transport protein-domain-containing protein [Infundibulicybe gibba]